MSRAARKHAYASVWKSFTRVLAEFVDGTIEEENDDDDDDEDDDVDEEEDSEDTDNDDDEGIELGLSRAVYWSKASKHRINRVARPSVVSKWAWYTNAARRARHTKHAPTDGSSSYRVEVVGGM